MYNYGIGGNEVKEYASEAISDIANNKTFLIQKLTVNDTVKPEAVYNLKSVEDVFEHYKPTQTVSFETKDGLIKEEEFKFSDLGDFGIKKIVSQSFFLTNLDSDVEQYTKLSKQFRNNKVLQSIIADAESKKALVNALTTLLTELNAQG